MTASGPLITIMALFSVWIPGLRTYIWEAKFSQIFRFMGELHYLTTWAE